MQFIRLTALFLEKHFFPAHAKIPNHFTSNNKIQAMFMRTEIGGTHLRACECVRVSFISNEGKNFSI